METPSVITNKISSINNVTSMHQENKNLEINQEKSKSTIKESNATKAPYHHSNYKGHCYHTVCREDKSLKFVRQTGIT